MTRLDALATISDIGDLDVSYYLRGVRPANGMLTEYPVTSSNDSKRATLVPQGFEDRHPKPNAVEGVVKVDPPASPEEPRDIRFGIRGKGVYTFSAEYCLEYKGTKREEFAFSSVKHVEELHMEIDFPEEFGPVNPKVEVVRKSAGKADEGRPNDLLLQEGKAFVDAVETEACREGFRYWPDHNRASLFVRAPLPGLTYRIVWDLPADEYDVPFQSAGSSLRERVRAAISAFRKKLLLVLEGARHESTLTEAFLQRFGESALRELGLKEPIRADLAIHVPERKEVLVVASMEGGPGAAWRRSFLPPPFALGETLRGKAYLRREPLVYHYLFPESKKDPDRHPADRQTRQQLAIPLVFPAEPPLYPRVGVATLSSDSEGTAFLDEVTKPETHRSLIELAHSEMQALAEDLGHAFPPVSWAKDIELP